MSQAAVHLYPVLADTGTHWDLERVVDDLRQSRTRWRAAHHNALGERDFPSRTALSRIITSLASALYPMRLRNLSMKMIHWGAKN